MMAQGHLQGGTPSLWGFTFQEAACDQWVLRPRVWTAHSPIKMTVYNCGHKPLHIGPSTRLGLALFWPAERSDNLDAGRLGWDTGRGRLAPGLAMSRDAASGSVHLDIQVDRAEEGWVCDVLLEPGPPTAREGCFLSMDPGLGASRPRGAA